MIQRTLEKLLRGSRKSLLLLGPRQTGKSTLVAALKPDLTAAPPDLAVLETTRRAAEQALKMAGITVDQVGVFEVHDCFTITGILACEALGLAKRGEGADYVLAGHTRLDGKTPFNTGGGLVGYGHPTGASGVRMAVDLWKQLRGKAGDYQVRLDPKRPYGLLINMGGNDKTVVSAVFRAAEAR